MEYGYKHFSHTHNLTMHEIPDGAEVSCSGCNSSATQTVYVCWRCNFFLHDQCFHATRSRKHPSHPSHPLTLVPYPTYPSNSFYCNSCKIIGTGFSYSCSDCDFDLHIQCAYSIAGATNCHQSHQVITNPHPHHISYPNQEIVPPYLHGQNTSMVVPNVASVSIPVPTPIPIPIPVHAQYQTTITQDSYMAQNGFPLSVPISEQNPISSAQNAYLSQNFSVSTSAQNSSIPQNIALVFVPTSAPNKQSESTHYGDESGQNRPKNEGIKHYSHPHGLVLVNLKHGKKKTTCSCCQETLTAKGYSCVEETCNFHLHESCFNLDKEIRHKSHPDHPLDLLSSSPYDNENGTFTCNACFKDGTGFTYHCSICEHDLHVKCANLKETVKREDHEHMLKLSYKCPLKGEEYTFYCDVCNRVVPKDHWTYYCNVCAYGTHLDCVDGEVCDETSEDPVVDVRNNLKRLEEAMEAARIDAITRANILNNI
ncbi:hypothetical protein L6452_20058 [Arctium lappa]|uniref:Uncharacterized protein n=1 Tax=Arctium lappa TaxID=4217 RepID=A0ACB9B9V1_ARCLA|nr:hypothetical protein L6452_20058 [Arctium lappa]